MTAPSSILWRRLDAPGHDAARLVQTATGWMVEGAAVFVENGSPARLDYRVRCDSRWQTTEGEVRGWLGDRDLDLGFTPATNLTQLRRVALALGQAADVPVAWIDVSTDSLEIVHQRYERRGETAYWYESPRFGYKALLEVGPEGFVRRYPDLWEVAE